MRRFLKVSNYELINYDLCLAIEITGLNFVEINYVTFGNRFSDNLVL